MINTFFMFHTQTLINVFPHVVITLCTVWRCGQSRQLPHANLRMQFQSPQSLQHWSTGRHQTRCRLASPDRSRRCCTRWQGHPRDTLLKYKLTSTQVINIHPNTHSHTHINARMLSAGERLVSGTHVFPLHDQDGDGPVGLRVATHVGGIQCVLKPTHQQHTSLNAAHRQ